MSSIKTPNGKINMINDRIKYGTDGGINVDANALVVNASNNFIGIGTSRPSYKLDISTNLPNGLRVGNTLLVDSSNNIIQSNGTLIQKYKINSLNIFNPDTGFGNTNIPDNNLGGYHTVINGQITGADGGTAQICIGGNVIASTTGTNFNTVIGYGSATNGTNNLSIGRNAVSGIGDNNTTIGFSTRSKNGSNQLTIGFDASSNSFGGIYGNNLRTNNFNLGINTNNPITTLDVSGNIKSSSGSTTMTNGFIYVPSASGPPINTPTSIPGSSPIYVDTSGTGRIYVNVGGTWRYTNLI